MVALVSQVADLAHEPPRQRLLKRQAVMLRILIDAMLVDCSRGELPVDAASSRNRSIGYDNVGTCRALQRRAAAGVVDRREHVVVLARPEEDAVAGADHRVIP